MGKISPENNLVVPRGIIYSNIWQVSEGRNLDGLLVWWFRNFSHLFLYGILHFKGMWVYVGENFSCTFEIARMGGFISILHVRKLSYVGNITFRVPQVQDCDHVSWLPIQDSFPNYLISLLAVYCSKIVPKLRDCQNI